MRGDKTVEYRVKGFVSAKSAREDFLPAGTLVGVTQSETLEEALAIFAMLNDNSSYGPYDHPFIIRSDGAVAAIVEHVPVNRFTVEMFKS